MVAFSRPQNPLLSDNEFEITARWHRILHIVQYFCWLHQSLAQSSPAKRKRVLHLMSRLARITVPPSHIQYFGMNYIMQLQGSDLTGACLTVHRSALTDHAFTTEYRHVPSAQFPQLHGLVATTAAKVGTIIADDEIVVWPITEAAMREILHRMPPRVLSQCLGGGNNAHDVLVSFFAMQLQCAKEEEHAAMLQVFESIVSQCQEEKVRVEDTFLPLVSWPENFSALALLFQLVHNNIDNTQRQIFESGFHKYKAQVAVECGLLGTKPADLLLVLALCEKMSDCENAWRMFCYIGSYHVKFHDCALLSNALGAANCPMGAECSNCQFNVLSQSGSSQERNRGNLLTSVLVHAQTGELVLAEPQSKAEAAPNAEIACLVVTQTVPQGAELRYPYSAPDDNAYKYVFPWDKQRSDRVVQNLLGLKPGICRIMLLQFMRRQHMQEALRNVLLNTSQPEKYKEALLAQGWLTQLTH